MSHMEFAILGPTAPSRADQTVMIGRDQLLAELTEAVATNRLVTLVGPAGVGKTTLATALATAGGVRVELAAGDVRLELAPGDVRLVELAAVVPGADLAAVVIDALGLRSESLVHALAGRELLLVLDGCEHLADAVGRLAGELLDGCPRLRILTTSREALGVPGETVFAVPGLAQEDAVRLFVERAHVADPAVQLDVPAIERICALVDGLPLAIELMAARVDSVALADMPLVSLRWVIAWSWGLLPPVERVIATRLTIFTGGATAESVAAVLDLPQPVTARLLATLTQRSLLTLTNGRYRMPETIRAYAAEQLTPAETDDLHARQAAYLLRLVHQADPHLRGPEQLHWATLLHQESNNLRAAINWTTKHDHRLALELIAGLSTYWWMHGLQREAARAATALLAVLGEMVPDGLAEEYLLAVLHAASSGRVDGIEQARTIVEELDEPFSHPITVLVWSLVLGPFEPPEYVSEVLARNELSTDPWTLAALQLCAGYPGLTGAAASEQTALTQFQLIGDRWGSSLALNALAERAAWSDQLDLSAELIGQALSIADDLGSHEEAALLLCRRGDLHLRLGKLHAASDDYGQALVLAERIGLPDSSAAARIGLARTARYDGNLPKAEELALQAVADSTTGWVGADLAATEALSELAAIEAAARPRGLPQSKGSTPSPGPEWAQQTQ